MKNKVLIIPELQNINESIKLAEEYACAFEYNDFIFGDVLDNDTKIKELINRIIDFPFAEESTIHGVFFDIAVFSSDSKIRDMSQLRVRQSMDIASRLKLKGVVFHTNYIPTFNTESYHDMWINNNKEFWIEILKEYPNTEVYMENMFDLYPYLLMRLAKEMEEYNKFGVCFDVGHANLSKIDMDIWIRTLGPYIKHIHINDNDKIYDAHFPLGKGEIDYIRFFNGIKNINSSILIEVNGIKNQRKSLEYLEANIIKNL